MSLCLSGMGSFHAGGRWVAITGEALRTARFTQDTEVTFDPNGHYVVEQAYVQWFRPAEVKASRGVLFVHGGGLTGAMWETTPDGRSGWVELFLGQGFPVYVLDGVERGRAGWCALPSVWEGDPIPRSAEWAWELFRLGHKNGFATRQAFAGQRFPIEALDAFVAGFVPRWLSTADAQTTALVAVLDRIGPVDLICHSQGGESAFRAAAARPGLVSRVVAIEPSGFDDGLDPARQTVLGLHGDFFTDTTVRLDLKLRAFAERFAGRGGRTEVWDLVARGESGHSHMPMMDRGNDVLAAEIGAWLLGATRDDGAFDSTSPCPGRT